MQLKKLFAAAVFSALMAGSASAHSILVAFNSATPSGSNWTYTYSITLAGGTGSNANTLSSGDYAVLYDFQGLVGTPTFTGPDAGDFGGVNVEATTPFPIAQGAGQTDSPAISNIEFTYTSGTNLNGNPVTGASIFLGTLTAVSKYGPSAGSSLYYAAQDHQTSGFSVQGNSGFDVGPTAVPAANAGFGGAAILLGLGAFSLVKSRRVTL